MGAARCTISGVAYRPSVGLLRAHRAADDQRETVQFRACPSLTYVLRAHVITDTHVREIAHSSRRRRVVRRGGQPITNLIDDDDEILVRIECVFIADIYLLDDLVSAGVPRGNKNGVGSLAALAADSKENGMVHLVRCRYEALMTCTCV